MRRCTQSGDAPLTLHFSTHDELDIGLSWYGSLTSTQDQIVSIVAMGSIRTGSVCKTNISFGVAVWQNLAMVNVVLAPICLSDG